MLISGKLNRRVTLQRLGDTWDAAGQLAGDWVDVVTVWANVRHQSGVKVIEGAGDTSIVKASIRIRYRSGISAGMRVVDGSTTYDIEAVLEGGRREYLDLVCETIDD